LLPRKIVKDVSKHLRPISLTPILSKVAEEFIIQEYVKPAVLKKIKSNQFGSIPKSSTTQALISMIHTWSKYTDGTGSTVRVVVFDFRKAFDLIDHNILVRKLKDLNIAHNIISWIVDFLKCRKQRVKLSQDCKSEWKNVPAGVPQETKLGPWLFVLMIDDIDTTNTDLWKYVDDTTAAEMVEKGETSKIQNIVNELTEKTYRNKFQFNEKKCKELPISFTKNHPEYAPIVINDKPIEIVTTIKLLGLNISNNLKWNHHIEEIAKKASTRLYFLRQLKHELERRTEEHNSILCSLIRHESFKLHHLPFICHKRIKAS
ncbi:RNA-directed DNA polymerase from mobile element jockey, partial [Paramuricea clavata]